MRLAQLDREAALAMLRDVGLGISVGPFSILLKSKLRFLSDSLISLYTDYDLLGPDGFFDFHVSVNSPLNPRRLLGRQVQFYFDGDAPFKPLPLNQAFPFFEWGLNWCVAQHAHQYLIIHAAVVEKEGYALVLPGNPGAGKSTLCAALVANGWRLLSDEMALIPSGGDRIVPIPRPISLKNDSIDLMKSAASKEAFGDSFHDTAKGTVAHMRPPQQSVARAGEVARPGLVIFPRFEAGSSPELESVSRSAAFLKMVEFAFNYDYLALEAVRRLQSLIESSACFSFTYPSLEAALDAIDKIWVERMVEA